MEIKCSSHSVDNITHYCAPHLRCVRNLIWAAGESADLVLLSCAITMAGLYCTVGPGVQFPLEQSKTMKENLPTNTISACMRGNSSADQEGAVDVIHLGKPETCPWR